MDWDNVTWKWYRCNDIEKDHWWKNKKQDQLQLCARKVKKDWWGYEQCRDGNGSRAFFVLHCFIESHEDSSSVTWNQGMRRERELMWLPSAISAYHTKLWVSSWILTECFLLIVSCISGDVFSAFGLGQKF